MMTATEVQSSTTTIEVKTFHEFLGDKVISKTIHNANAIQPEFGKIERLRYSYINTQESKGVWNTIKGAVLGLFFSSTFNALSEDDQEALKKQAAFYKQCCKVQNCYNKFTNKSDNQDFTKLQTAYEKLLAFAETEEGDLAEQHDMINTILNLHFNSKDREIGAAILERAATNKFTESKFGTESIVDVLPTLLTEIQAKYAAGYRGKLSETERNGVASIDRRHNEVANILHSDGIASITAAYAQAYRKQCENSSTGMSLSMDIAESLEKKSNKVAVLTDEVIERQIDSYNKLILELVTDPNKQVPLGALPHECQTEAFITELDRMAGVYSVYNEALESLSQETQKLNALKAGQTKCAEQLAKEEAKTKTLTMKEIADIEGLSDGLQGVEKYKQVQQTLDLSHQAVGEAQEAVDTKKEQLSAEIERLETAIKTAEGELTTSKQAVKDARSLLKEAQELAEKEIKKLATDSDKESSVEDLDVAEATKQTLNLARMKKALNTAVKTYTTQLREQQARRTTLEERKTELEQLEKQSSKHELIAALNKATDDREKILKQSVTLTHAEIAAIEDLELPQNLQNIVHVVTTLKQQHRSFNTDITTAQKRVEEMTEVKNQAIASLKAFGFDFDQEDGITGLKYKGFRDEYKKRLQKEREEKSFLFANILDVFQTISASENLIREAGRIGGAMGFQPPVRVSQNTTTSELDIRLGKLISRTVCNQNGRADVNEGPIDFSEFEAIDLQDE